MVWARLANIRPDKDHPSRQLGEQKEEEDRGRDERKTSQNGQVWTSQRHKGGIREAAKSSVVPERQSGLRD